MFYQFVLRCHQPYCTVGVCALIKESISTDKVLVLLLKPALYLKHFSFPPQYGAGKSGSVQATECCWLFVALENNHPAFQSVLCFNVSYTEGEVLCVTPPTRCSPAPNSGSSVRRLSSPLQTRTEGISQLFEIEKQLGCFMLHWSCYES